MVKSLTPSGISTMCFSIMFIGILYAGSLKTLACTRGTGILPVFHGRDAHATRGFARVQLLKLKTALPDLPRSSVS